MTQPYEPEQSGDPGSDVVVIDEPEDDENGQGDDAALGSDEVVNGTAVNDADDDLDEDDLTGAEDEAGQGSLGVAAEPTVGADSYEPSHAAGDEASVAASREWLDIQAMFVDDPSGAVRLAAAQADSAVSALVTALQEQQAALAQAGGTSGDGSAADPAETEQLRSALRGYRSLCQSLAQIGPALSAPGATASGAMAR